MASSNTRIQGITIEIGGETTKLQSALKAVNSTIKETQGALKDVNTLLKLDPNNTELLKQKQEILAKEIEATAEKLQKEKDALEQLKNADNSDETIKQQQALEREIIATTQALEKLKGEAKDAASVLGTQMRNAGEEVKKVGESIKSAGESVTEIGKGLSKVSAVAAGGLGATVKTAADFDSAMSQVAATMGYTVDELRDGSSEASKNMAQLSAFAQEMGSTTAFSASEAAEALNYMALAGYDAETSMQMLPTVLNLAAAGGIDLASASDMVTDAQSALGLTLEETAVMVDQMAAASSKSNTSVAQLGEAFLTIGATASNLAGGTQELATMLGVLADNGIKASEGGTHLRNIILSLQNAAEDGAVDFGDFSVALYDADGNMRSTIDIVKDMQSNMEGMNQESKDAIISGVFNKTDLASVNALLNTSATRFDELGASINSADGAAADMAAVQLDNLNGQLTLLKSALEGLAISLGTILMPMISKVVELVSRFVDWLNSLDEGQQQMIVTVGLVVAAIGPLVMIIGNVISVVGTVVSGIGTLLTILGSCMTFIVGTAIPAIVGFIAAFWPVIAVLAAVVAAIAGVIAIIKNWDKITEWFKERWAIFGEKIAAIKDVFLDLVHSAADWGRDLINNFIDGIKAKIDSLKDMVSNVAQTVANFLHFSEPDEGPLSNFHTFAPDMIDLWNETLKDNLYKMDAPLNEMASKIASPAQNSLDANSIYEAVRTGASNSNITLTIGDREFTRALKGMGVSFT